MESLNYFIISLVSFTGLIIGYSLLYFAPEEKKPGMKYFSALNYILFGLSALLAVYFQPNPLLISFLLISILLFIYLKKFQVYTAYILFSILFFVFADNFNAFIVFAVLIFVYGLVAGAIMFQPKNRKKELIKMLCLLYFVLLANLLRLAL